MKIYSLRKSKKILVSVYHLLRRKKKKLLPAQVNEIQQDLRNLQEEILKENREGANYAAHKCEDYGDGILKKSGFEQARDFVFALFFALIVALVIRQVWFELYNIPTGSMRPTFKEKDHVVVSKTTFGINIPFTTKHLYFDPDLVKRSGTVVFTVENMDVQDADTLYFWIFPGKKQFVKRMIGKPGDTLYFYGGRVYGIDAKGNDISAELQPELLSGIEHIPYIRVGGDVSVSEPFRSNLGSAYRMAIIHQMNEPVARLTVLSNQRLEGEMVHMPRIHNRDAPPVENYYELWGIGNYAPVRIVKKEKIRSLAERINTPLGDEDYYLEIKHHPNLKSLNLVKDQYGRVRPQFLLSTSFLPLDEEKLRLLQGNLFTGRFVVKNGYLMRYSMGGSSCMGTHFLTKAKGIPDGTYEFFNGQGYEIKWGGIAQKLKPSHPLMIFNPKMTKKLFNYGVEFDKRVVYGPHFNTERFAYFRDGDLIVMGTPLFRKGESVLEDFTNKECRRAEESNRQNDYIPFVDEGPPLTDEGKIDTKKIRQFGLLIPEKGYLALGDNYSNSGDSRVFGFVPEGNLRGTPSFIFWPPGPRFGPPLQPSYPIFTLPNLIIWFLAAICFLLWYRFYGRYRRLPLKDL